MERPGFRFMLGLGELFMQGRGIQQEKRNRFFFSPPSLNVSLRYQTFYNKAPGSLDVLISTWLLSG